MSKRRKDGSGSRKALPSSVVDGGVQLEERQRDQYRTVQPYSRTQLHSYTVTQLLSAVIQ